jgi:hypothetical protein
MHSMMGRLFVLGSLAIGICFAPTSSRAEPNRRFDRESGRYVEVTVVVLTWNSIRVPGVAIPSSTSSRVANGFRFCSGAPTGSRFATNGIGKVG